MTPEFHRDDQWWVSPGMPAVSDDDVAAIKQIARLGLPSKIYTFVRAITPDIDKSLECGANGVSLEEFREIAERVLADAASPA
jgi:hypothetical protein